MNKNLVWVLVALAVVVVAFLMLRGGEAPVEDVTDIVPEEVMPEEIMPEETMPEEGADTDPVVEEEEEEEVVSEEPAAEESEVVEEEEEM